MPSNKSRKPPSNASPESSAIAEFNRTLHHSIHQIELLIENAKDAADISRTYAAQAKESAQKSKPHDVWAFLLLSVGISGLFTGAALLALKHSIANSIQPQVKHEVRK
ncbi:hypothetical protein NC981_19240 [Leptolyngbya sp. DQ-M1]|uniref:hypothetical protein n=1 Tax=Leptolyngbya sp. DQ-M1 TaxID=2933920 RepID=UPI003298427E